MKPMALSLVVFGLLFGGDDQAKAEIVLDQSFDPNSIPPSQTFGAGFISGVDTAQTFTVGRAGILSRVDVFVSLYVSLDEAVGLGPLLFDIRPTSITGAPIESNSMALASLVIPAVDVQAPLGRARRQGRGVAQARSG